MTTNYVVAVLGLSQVLVETMGGSTTRYVYGHDLLAEYDGTEWTYHLNDGLGSVRQLTDASGDVTLAQGYTPFGVPLWSEGSGSTGYGFTGERWEAYSHLVFLRARYYEPGTGRFSSLDPVPGQARNPQSRHGYTYAWNRPNQLIDPSGRQIPPGHCTPGEICFTGTTGPYVNETVFTGPYRSHAPMRVGRSYIFPGHPRYRPTWQPTLVSYCHEPLWQILHYATEGNLYARFDAYPYLGVQEPEIPIPGFPGVQYQPELGNRHATIYDLELTPPQLTFDSDYDESYTNQGVGLGIGDANVGTGVEIGNSPSLTFQGDFVYAEAQLSFGTETIQGTLTIEQPGDMVLFQRSWSLGIAVAIDRYLIAWEEDVEKAGGPESYGQRRIGRKYHFAGVMMQNYNKWVLELDWRALYCDSQWPKQPECEMMRLEEYP